MWCVIGQATTTARVREQVVLGVFDRVGSMAWRDVTKTLSARQMEGLFINNVIILPWLLWQKVSNRVLLWYLYHFQGTDVNSPSHYEEWKNYREDLADFPPLFARGPHNSSEKWISEKQNKLLIYTQEDIMDYFSFLKCSHHAYFSIFLSTSCLSLGPERQSWLVLLAAGCQTIHHRVVVFILFCWILLLKPVHGLVGGVEIFLKDKQKGTSSTKRTIHYWQEM